MNRENIKVIISTLMLIILIIITGVFIHKKIEVQIEKNKQEIVKVENKEKIIIEDNNYGKEKNKELKESEIIEKVIKYLESTNTYEEKIEVIDKENETGTLYNFEIFAGKDEDTEEVKQRKINDIVGEEKTIDQLEKELEKILKILKMEDAFSVIDFKTEYDKERQPGENIFLVKKISGKISKKEYSIFIKAKYLVNKNDKPTNRVKSLYITVHDKTDQERIMKFEAKKLKSIR